MEVCRSGRKERVVELQMQKMVIDLEVAQREAKCKLLIDQKKLADEGISQCEIDAVLPLP